MDMPPTTPLDGVPVCVETAASRYQIPLRAMIALWMTEGGKIGQSVSNTNGTADHGPFQINDVWIETMQRHGYSRELLTNNFCASAMAAAWILRTEINRANGDFWVGVGNYHSRTPKYHLRYIQKVYANSEMIDAK